MSGMKELARHVWSRIAEVVQHNRKSVIIASGVLAAAAAALLFAGSCSQREHAAAVHREEDHQEKQSVVKLSAEAQKTAGITVRTAAPESLSAPIEATAAVELNGDKVANVSARTSGRLVRITALQGDVVKANQPLAYFDSPELGQAWAEYSKAKGRVEASRKNVSREETLFEKKISPEKDVIRARQELAEAEADLSFAREKFHLLGVDIDRFEMKREGEHQHPLIAIASPISGTVIERTATQGEVVGPEKAIFTIADLSSLWVIIDIYEKDLGRVRQGTPVKVVTAAYADKTFRGVISHVGDVMDDKTRTVKARVAVENGNRLLKPGMFATVSIDVKGAQTEKAIMAPDEAVLMDGEERFVFVMTGPETFEKREVRPGRMIGKNVEIVEGLHAGDKVAVTGAFILKSELKKGELVAEHGHGD
ncbi:MAG: efflux RND transporter periplasmic adaptor subunit [Nitrospirota bacterium]